MSHEYKVVVNKSSGFGTEYIVDITQTDGIQYVDSMSKEEIACELAIRRFFDEYSIRAGDSIKIVEVEDLTPPTLEEVIKESYDGGEFYPDVEVKRVGDSYVLKIEKEQFLVTGNSVEVHKTQN